MNEGMTAFIITFTASWALILYCAGAVWLADRESTLGGWGWLTAVLMWHITWASAFIGFVIGT